MARIYTVKAARQAKKPRFCVTCNHVIQPGESYRYFELYTGGPKYYCKDHYPRPSHLTNSKLSEVYAAQEGFEDTIEQIGSAEEIQELVRSIAEVAASVAEEYSDSLNCMPTQEGPTAEEMQEKIDALEEYANELDQWEPEDAVDEREVRNEQEALIGQVMVRELKSVPAMTDDQFEKTTNYKLIFEYGDWSEFENRVDAAVEGIVESEDLAPVRESALEAVGALQV